MFLLLLLCLPVIFADPEAPRVVNGVEVRQHQFPHHVGYYFENEDGAMELVCGGSIISKSWILSAAHCVQSLEAKSLIRAGSVKSWGGKAFKIKRTVVHPKWNDYFHTYDFALFELSTPLPYNYAVQPIQLPVAQSEVPEGSNVTVIGWGRITEDGPVSENLMMTSLTTINRAQCQERLIHDTITPVHICAIGYETDACQGDSGGSLFYDSTIVGVVSFGDGCARPDKPGVYANVAQVVDWIKEVAEI